MANRKKSLTARNITFTLGFIRRKRKTKKITSLRESYPIPLVYLVPFINDKPLLALSRFAMRRFYRIQEIEPNPLLI